MLNFKFNSGILGLNARNLLYIREHNSRKQIKFADSKLKTKYFLSARGIPVPKLYAVIKTHEDLNNFDFQTLPNNIVLKPNKGSGGDGILVFKSKNNQTFTTVNNTKIPLEEIKSHIADIIDGKYSITNTNDTALFEQRIVTHHALSRYTYQGLPDVRIIVYNLVPVMAMLRLPTKESLGKANMALGALGVGIDIGTGKPTYIAKKFKIISGIPEVGKFNPKFTIPYWDDILLIASKCQKITNLGYLACDIALDEHNGPILLELNARAGLKVQIANKAPLRKRLDKVKDIKVQTPEKGVRIAKELFTNKDALQQKTSTHKIINLEETVEIFVNNLKKTVLAKINLDQPTATISRQLAEQLQITSSQSKLKLNIKDQKILTLATVTSSTKSKTSAYDLILGAKEVQNFLIKPILNQPKLKFSTHLTTTKKAKSIETIDYGIIDYKVHTVHQIIKLLRRIKPINYLEEIQKIRKDNSYNPQFLYKPAPQKLLLKQEQLNSLKLDNSPLGKIFKRKIQELNCFIEIISNIGTDKFTDSAKKLFKHPTAKEIKIALEYQKNYHLQKSQLSSEYLNSEELAKFFREVLSSYALNHWKTTISSNIISECSIGHNNHIYIKENRLFNKLRTRKLIAHELETHILTTENGKKQPYQIFQDGTANYIQTQEGLAIYNQELALGIHPKNHFVSNVFIYTDIALKNSFSDAVEIIRRLGNERKKAINIVMKTKRGLSDTSQKGGIAKQAVYFRGALEIDKFVKQGGDLKQLYIGKISIEELEYYNQIKSLNKAYLLPKWY